MTQHVSAVTVETNGSQLFLVQCSFVNSDASESFKTGMISKEIIELYSTGGLLLVLSLLYLLCSNSYNNFSPLLICKESLRLKKTSKIISSNHQPSHYAH